MTTLGPIEITADDPHTVGPKKVFWIPAGYIKRAFSMAKAAALRGSTFSLPHRQRPIDPRELRLPPARVLALDWP